MDKETVDAVALWIAVGGVAVSVAVGAWKIWREAGSGLKQFQRDLDEMNALADRARRGPVAGLVDQGGRRAP